MNWKFTIVPALVFNGKKRQYLEGQYYYVFRWCQGKTADWEHITSYQSSMAGNFLQSYMEELNEWKIPWSKLLGLGYSWIEWLDYNIRRALGIECSDEEERQMGISQVHMTLNRILYYKSQKEKILAFLTNLK